jgi:NDP-sugar pyrophosphorylase family protein
VKALVLAGGMATRLEPLSARIPKALVPVANRPVLSHVLRNLKAAAITDIGITCSPGAEAMTGYFGTGQEHGVSITWLREPVPAGTGGALRDNREFFEGEPVLVVPADIIAAIDITALIADYLRYPAAVTLTVAPRDLSSWNGDIVVADGPDGVSYHFKPGRNALSDLGSLGTWIVDPRALDLIPAGFADFSSDILPRLPVPGCGLGVYDAGDIYQRDFGVFHSFHAGNLEAVRGLAGVELPRAVPVGDRDAVAHGPVLIGADAVIEPGAHIYGPAVIGPAATVSAGAQVVASVILPGAHIPPGMIAAFGVFGNPSCLLEAMMRYRAGADKSTEQLVASGHDPEWYLR